MAKRCKDQAQRHSEKKEKLRQKRPFKNGNGPNNNKPTV